MVGFCHGGNLPESHHHHHLSVPRKEELGPSLGVPTAKVEPTGGPEMDDNHDQP